MRELLALLGDGRFHSGEELGQRLGISRSAVWKRLRALRDDYGIELHSIPGRGYRLTAPITLLDEPTLAVGLADCGWRLHVCDQIDSTNTEALRRLAAGEEAPFVVMAEQQSAGRGRRGRVWASPYGQNLYYSLALKLTGGVAQLQGLSLSVGLAVVKALQGLGLTEAGVKWPNDVLVDGRKIAGILVDIQGDPADVYWAVIGIGVNVNMHQIASVDQPWTSMAMVDQQDFDRTQVALDLSRALKHCLDQHLSQGFATLREQWQQVHVWQGRDVVLSVSEHQALKGRALGVDDGGALLLLINGQERAFNAGELTLRLDT